MIGAGVIGLAAAWHLLRLGRDAGDRGALPDRPQSGQLARQRPDDAEHVRCVIAAAEAIRALHRLVASRGADVLRRHGSVASSIPSAW